MMSAAGVGRELVKLPADATTSSAPAQSLAGPPPRLKPINTSGAVTVGVIALESMHMPVTTTLFALATMIVGGVLLCDPVVSIGPSGFTPEISPIVINFESLHVTEHGPVALAMAHRIATQLGKNPEFCAKIACVHVLLCESVTTTGLLIVLCPAMQTSKSPCVTVLGKASGGVEPKPAVPDAKLPPTGLPAPVIGVVGVTILRVAC